MYKPLKSLIPVQNAWAFSDIRLGDLTFLFGHNHVVDGMIAMDFSRLSSKSILSYSPRPTSLCLL